MRIAVFSDIHANIEALSAALHKIPKTVEKIAERLVLCPVKFTSDIVSKQVTLLDQGTTILFVADGSENYSVKPGDRLGDQYRLEELTETHATFVYLPLGERQTLVLRSRD